MDSFKTKISDEFIGHDNNTIKYLNSTNSLFRNESFMKCSSEMVVYANACQSNMSKPYTRVKRTLALSGLIIIERFNITKVYFLFFEKQPI